MSQSKKNKNKTREQQTYDRFLYMKKASELLMELFDKGFKNSEALSAMLKINDFQFDSARLLNFYNFRLRDEEVLKALEECLQKLN